MQPLFRSADELNAALDLFQDPARTSIDNRGPFVLVKDGFYPDPHAVRELALRQTFFQYSPPLESQVGVEATRAFAAKFPDPRPAWMSTSLLRYLGQEVRNPQPGYRHAPGELRSAIAELLDEHVTEETWDEMGDWWNGAFHVMFDAWAVGRGSIHHHYKFGDVAPRGWSGLVYLTPDAPPAVGTSIWREKATGKCVAANGAKFDRDVSKFELALLVENRFNRLVLFRENVLHRAEHGFGTTPETARLTQTFFFHAEPRPARQVYAPAAA